MIKLVWAIDKTSMTTSTIRWCKRLCCSGVYCEAMNEGTSETLYKHFLLQPFNMTLVFICSNRNENYPIEYREADSATSLTESGSTGTKDGGGDSVVGPHAVGSPGWNSPSCSSLTMKENIKNQQRWFRGVSRSCPLLLSNWITIEFVSKPRLSPVPVVWSVGGSVSLLALCLSHMGCPSLVSVHWHWLLSNVHCPETWRWGVSNTAGKMKGGEY